MVHPAAAEGFARAAEAYERARPAYPAPIVDFVAQHAGRDVVELAAGTGKMTRLLLMAGMRVTAVEPVAEMRAALPAGAGAVAGTAEAIPLPSSCADGVVVAQAWHLFDTERALPDAEREGVLEQARALGEADLPYVCEAEAWMRLSEGSTDSL